MAAPSLAASGKQVHILNSWKEIATYMGRGVRTVQRYEHDFGLPVRRLGGKLGRAVVALPQDLDAWLHSAPLAELRGKPEPWLSAIADATRVSRAEGEKLRGACRDLRAQNHEIVQRLCASLSTLVGEFQKNSKNLAKGN